jgi:hypothetical protein
MFSLPPVRVPVADGLLVKELTVIVLEPLEIVSGEEGRVMA